MSKHVASAKKKPTAGSAARPRRLYLPKRVWYNPLSWRFAPPPPAYKPLPKARRIFSATLRELWANKGLFGGIVAIYGVLNLVLVRSLSGSSNLTTLKAALDSVMHGFGGQVVSSLGSFAYLLATSGSGSAQNSGAYQYLLVLFCSLALIWSLRQTIAKHKVRIRDCFYQGMYPLVPFFLVFLIVCVQLIPLAASGSLFGVALANNIAIAGWQKAIFVCLFIVLGYWSLRMITSSIFALYIVTLPDMTPLRAIRSAKQLVYGRRLLVWRKLVFLPFMLLMLSALIELPLILLVTPLAAWVFFVISMASLPIVHGYLYRLYREMI